VERYDDILLEVSCYLARGKGNLMTGPLIMAFQSSKVMQVATQVSRDMKTLKLVRILPWMSSLLNHPMAALVPNDASKQGAMLQSTAAGRVLSLS